MAVYLVSLIDVADVEEMRRYQQSYPALVEAHGGRFLARGGGVAAIEGQWTHDRLVLMEFPNRAAALAWYQAPEYQPYIAQRQRYAKTTMLMVDGLNETPPMCQGSPP